MIPFDAWGAHISHTEIWLVLPVLPIGSNWTGLMEQDGCRLQQMSLQRGLNRLLESHFTDKQKRRSRNVTSGASLLFSLYRPGLRCLSARTRIISATRTKKIQRNTHLETCVGLGVLQQEVEGLHSTFCESVPWRNNSWHYSFCLWFVGAFPVWVGQRGSRGGEQCKDSSSVRKVHRLVLTEFSSL